MGLFFLVLLIHFFLFSRLFDTIYVDSMLNVYQNELFQATRNFTGGNERLSNAELREYTSQTRSPVLVFDQNHRLSDGEFFRSLGVISVREADGNVVYLPINYFYSLTDYPRLSVAQRVQVLAVPLGDSVFYEPLIIATEGRAFTNIDSLMKYRDHARNFSGIVEHTRYLQPGQDVFTYYADKIYDQVKDILIMRLGIEEYLERISNEPVIDRFGNEYRLFTERLSYGENTWYFVSLRRILFTGQEISYLRVLFFGIYAVLGVLLVISAILMSRYISKPLRYLSEMTEKISSLDFTQSVKIRRSDELGQLADNVNAMSHSLEQALESTRKNEQRMKVLLANLAHEFKTPLGLIQMYTEMFEKGLFDDDPDAYYCKLETEVVSLTRMVNDVIELSRLQSGVWKVEMGVWQLNDIINSVLDTFEANIRQGGYKLELRLKEVEVQADARRISQVLSNLINNALIYTDERKYLILSVMDASEYAEICIYNGGSLSETDRERIWERYYSTDSQVPARLPSGGIGLDIVRSILDAHHSKYGVRQEDGMVCFHFTLKKAD